MRPTLATLERSIADRRETASSLAEACLAEIARADGEGARAFVSVRRDVVLAQAAAADKLIAHGIRQSPLAGIPVSVKDLLDVQGEVTRAGSKVLSDRPAATQDAAIVARLRRAGAVIVGRTNMTEFAYGGIGYNPHYGTPASPWDRKTGRIPGGSSSGAAVSVADGMAHAAIGTDTGGSCRIPAAFCGVVGYKPTANAVPLTGCFPLATSLDSIGPLTRSVACAALVHDIISGAEPQPIAEMLLTGQRLLLPTNLVLDAMDAPVAAAFERALGRLSAAGANIVRARLATLDRHPELFGKGGIGAAECYAHHAQLIAERGEGFDPKVRVRMEIGATQAATDYIALRKLRAELTALFDSETAAYDAVIMPAVPIVAPAIALFGPHQSFEDYARINAQTLRNTAIANQMDRCSISIPCQAPGEPGVGLMLVGERGRDRALFRLAAAAERALAGLVAGS